MSSVNRASPDRDWRTFPAKANAWRVVIGWQRVQGAKEGGTFHLKASLVAWRSTYLPTHHSASSWMARITATDRSRAVHALKTHPWPALRAKATHSTQCEPDHRRGEVLLYAWSAGASCHIAADENCANHLQKESKESTLFHSVCAITGKPRSEVPSLYNLPQIPSIEVGGDAHVISLDRPTCIWCSSCKHYSHICSQNTLHS